MPVVAADVLVVVDLVCKVEQGAGPAVDSEQLAHPLDVLVRALEDHVEHDLERRLLKLSLPGADVLGTRTEVEQRVGVHVMDADAALLEEARLFGDRSASRIEVVLEPFEVRRAPGAALAVRSVAAPLDVVGVVVHVPVANVDHVEHRTVRLLAAAPDRLLEEEAERPGGELLAA